MYDILELNTKLLTELRDIAKSLKIKRVEAMKKQDLIFKILDQQAIKTIAPIAPPAPKKVKLPSTSHREPNYLENELMVSENPSQTFPAEEIVTVVDESAIATPRRRGRPAGLKREKAVVSESLFSNVQESVAEVTDSDTYSKQDVELPPLTIKISKPVEELPTPVEEKTSKISTTSPKRGRPAGWKRVKSALEEVPAVEEEP